MEKNKQASFFTARHCDVCDDDTDVCAGGNADNRNR